MFCLNLHVKDHQYQKCKPLKSRLIELTGKDKNNSLKDD